MENIGQILKERRQELGYSLEEMNVKTKLSVQQLQAIEDGNIQYFKEDLSYLSYFVRYYANSLDLNYDEMRGELDNTITAYTDSVTMLQAQRQEDITSNVKKKTEAGEVKAKPTLNRAKRTRKLDLPSVGLLVLAISIVAFLIYLSAQYLIPSIVNSKDPIQKPEITLPETEKPEEEGKEDPKEPEKPVTPESTLKVTQTSPTSYDITGWVAEADVNFDFVFNTRTWISFTEDGVELANPAATIYEVGTNAKVILKAKADKTLVVNYGAFSGNTIKINGTEVPIHADIANETIAELTFRFVEGAQ